MENDLEIKATDINFLCTNLTQNGHPIGGGGILKFGYKVIEDMYYDPEVIITLKNPSASYCGLLISASKKYSSTYKFSGISNCLFAFLNRGDTYDVFSTVLMNKSGNTASPVFEDDFPSYGTFSFNTSGQITFVPGDPYVKSVFVAQLF